MMSRLLILLLVAAAANGQSVTGTITLPAAELRGAVGPVGPAGPPGGQGPAGAVATVSYTNGVCTIGGYSWPCSSGTAPPPPPQSTTPLALSFDPPCPAIVLLSAKIGTAFATPALATCYGGGEKGSAIFELFTESGANAYTAGWRINAVTGVISNAATGPAGSGVLIVRRSTASGVRLEFSRNWVVAL